MSHQEKPPKVFISYSHDSRLHLDRVLELADRLRAEGIDCNLDQYEPAPAEGWPRWMDKQFQDAEFILVVCTETYCRRFEGREEHGKGLGVKWEGAIITDELYSSESVNKRFIPIVFSNDDALHVPRKLQRYRRHLIADDGGYEELYRRLTNQPRVVKPELGKLRSFEPINKLRSLPSEDRQQEFVPINLQVLYKGFIVGERLGDGVELEMIAIPGGTFQMGSNIVDNEKPIHPVTLPPFHIGKYPITQAQWQAVMKNNPSYFRGDKLPVERVSWEMATEFCQKLSEKTGRNYRLPTEAEWEYACRADSTGMYCFGDDDALLEKYAWYSKNAGDSTQPVGEKLPNDWGLYDMHGNVWEWCQDRYTPNYYQQSPRENPQGPSSGVHRVLHGGSWSDDPFICRSASRFWGLPGGVKLIVGFRVVCVVRTP